MDDVLLVEGDKTRHLKICSKLTKGLRGRLIDFLRSNTDCFAWSHAEMPGIDPEIIMHKLQVDPLHQPARQKRRKFAPERDAIINNEVKSLLDTGFIHEVQYPDWLANIVVVKKNNEMCRVHQLHGSQQIMSKGPLPTTLYRQVGRHHRGAPADELH